jgi:DNA-directed RNA polymerase subunit E"
LSEKACRNCHAVVEGNVCPICKGSSLSNDWSGYVIVLDPPNSAIAKRLNIDQPGKYALKVR